MHLFHLVIGGMKGRKRDSAVLGSILSLAFLFLTLSSVLLTSFSGTADLRRKALHGEWQALYYGADDEAAERCAALTGCGKIGLVGGTKDGRLIGTVDETVLGLGSFELTEGRLPQSEDEILLVRGRMGSDPALGEIINVTYSYDYMQDEKSVSSVPSDDAAVIMSVRQTMTEEDCESFRTYLRDNYDPESGSVTFRVYDFWENEQFSFPFNLQGEDDLDNLPDHIEDDLLFLWAENVYGPEKYGDNPFKTSSVLAKPGELLGFEGSQITVQKEGFRTDYVGRGFTDEVRKRFKEVGMSTTATIIYKKYTVVGYVSPYADHWDVRGLSMPDAFVSPSAAEAQLRALRYAEQYYTEGCKFFSPSCVLLLGGPDGSVRQTTELVLPVYQEAQKPYFRMEGFVNDLYGEENGFITGLDPATGEEKSCRIRIYRGAGVTSYSIWDGGVWFGISGDPSSPERWKELSRFLLPLNPTELTFGDLEQNNVYTLRLNNYSYPPSGSSERSLQLLCSGVLIGVAAFSVFQVFWVQLRRRRVRLSTMMSVGASDGQIFVMLLLEVMFLLAFSAVVGTAAGFGLARLITWLSGARLSVDAGFILGGAGCCAAAVLVGALIPMLTVLHVPLTGREQTSRLALRLKTPSRAARQNYGRILLRQMTVNRGRTLLQLLLAWLLMTVGLLTVFLCHDAFGGYRRSVTDTAKPDYEVTAPYGMSMRYLESSLEEAKQLTDGSRISFTVEAPNVWLNVGGLIENSPVISTLRDIPEAQPMFRDLGGGETGFAVRVVGVTPDSDVLNALLGMLPPDTVDPEELDEGDSCILLVPRYMPDGDGVMKKTPDETAVRSLRADELGGYLLDLHYSDRYRSVCREDSAVKPGDQISLTAYRQKVTEIRVIEDAVTLHPRVAAVISVLDSAVWPFSETDAPYVVVSGVDLVTSLYRSASSRMTAEQAKNHRKMAELFYPDCYGITRFSIYNLPGNDPLTQDTAAADFAEDLGLDFTNRRIPAERELAAAQQKQMMYLLLGAEMSLVVLTLLFSTADVAAEQDRFRIGTLQALGVTRAQIDLGQFIQSLAVAATACAAANLTLLAVQFAASLFSRYPSVAFAENLSGYPWAIHALVCVLLTVLYSVLYSLPIRRVSRLDPIENIRS